MTQPRERTRSSLDREVDWVIKYNLIEAYREQARPPAHPPPGRAARPRSTTTSTATAVALLQAAAARAWSSASCDRRRHRRGRSTPRRRPPGPACGASSSARAKERKRDYTVDWVHLKLNDQAQRTVLCKDPFRSQRRARRAAHRRRCSGLPSACRDAVVPHRRGHRAPRRERAGLQRVEVDLGDGTGARLRAHAAHRAGAPSATRSSCNTTAVELGPRHRRLARRALEPGARRARGEPGPGHIMKLRYTSLQVDAGTAEVAHPEVGRRDPRRHAGGGVHACTARWRWSALAFAARRARAPPRRT